MRNEIPKYLRSGKNNLTYDRFESISNTNKHKAYNDMLEGKTVIIVGPSSHLFETEQKDFIESFDVIVRVNKSFPVKEHQEKYIGKRTNILYHCLEQSEENCGKFDYNEIKKQDILIATPYPKNMTPFHRDYVRFENEILNKNIKTNYIDISFYSDFMELLGTRPNTGISAIADLLCYDIKSLYVCGFTFFETGFYEGYRDIGGMKKLENGGTEWTKYDKNFNNNHIQSLQKDFIKNQLDNDNRLNVEDKLKEILNK